MILSEKVKVENNKRLCCVHSRISEKQKAVEGNDRSRSSQWGSVYRYHGKGIDHLQPIEAEVEGPVSYYRSAGGWNSV